MTRNDRMVGNVLGAVGKLPDIYIEINVKFYLMKQLLGMKKESEGKSSQKIKKIVEEEVLKFNVAST
jgi:translation initiation factor 2 subunit 3